VTFNGVLLIICIDKHSETSRRHLPDASAVLNLLGRLFRGHGDLLRAGESFYQSHKANPFTWDAFKGLCEIGMIFPEFRSLIY